MEKQEITLSLDSEKMRALVFYLMKENTTVQKKMDEALAQLYERTAPESLREYLDAKDAPHRRKRPPRPASKANVEQRRKTHERRCGTAGQLRHGRCVRHACLHCQER